MMLSLGLVDSLLFFPIILEFVKVLSLFSFSLKLFFEFSSCNIDGKFKINFI